MGLQELFDQGKITFNANPAPGVTLGPPIGTDGPIFGWNDGEQIFLNPTPGLLIPNPGQPPGLDQPGVINIGGQVLVNFWGDVYGIDANDGIASAILHEFAHLLGIIPSDLVRDANGKIDWAATTRKSEENHQLIIEKCFKEQ